MAPVPLGELCDLLRADGFTIGVDHHVRIGRLLARDIGWTPEMLRTALAAIVVTDPGERKRFDACWERWLAGAEPLPPPPQSPPVRPVLPAPARWPIRLAGAIAVAVSIAVGVLHQVAGGHGSPDPVPLVVDAPAAKSAPVRGSAGPPPPGASAPAGEARRPPQVRWPEPRIPELIAALVALAAGATLLVLVAASALVAARMRRRLLSGPWRYLLAVPPGTRHEPVLSQAAIEHAVADLTWLGSEAGPELDVPRSVADAVERGGFAAPVYRRGPAAPRYVVLEDTADGADRWRFLYDELLAGLAGEGFEIARYTFAANLDHLTSRDGDVVALGPVIDHAEAVIVIGGGDAAINALTGERARWLTALQHVPRRLWINPFPPARWSAGARAIATDIPMEHGVARAFTAVRVGVDRHGGADQIFPAVIERNPGTVSAIRALREAIGPRAFQLLAAVAVLGPPTISLARWIAKRHARRLRDLRERDWLAVVTLPWFRARAWPDGMRDRLCAALRTLNPALARHLTRDSDELFARGEPVPGCGAHLAWRLDGARRAWLRGERRTAARELRRLTWTPLFRQTRAAMAALGVRERLRIALAVGLVIGSLLVGSAVGYLADARSIAAARARRLAERHLEKLAGDGARLVPPTGSAWPDVFAVRVVDGNGAAVAGARVVWSDPASGPRSYIATSGADGRSAAPQLYASAPRDDREQVAQLITRWDGDAMTEQPVPADGERKTFRFAQVDPTVPGPCEDAMSRRQWAALQDCAGKLADPVRAQTLLAMARRELAYQADVASVQGALNAGDLKTAEASLRRIGSDSVYLTELRDAFSSAEDREIARLQLAAQRYADARNCRGLRDYVARIAPSTTTRAAAALRAVPCAGPAAPPAAAPAAAPAARCAALDLSAVKQKALDRYHAGDPRAALAAVLKVLSCGTADATLYTLATEYACSAKDTAVALQHFAHVEAAARDRVLQFCRNAHVDLLRPPCDTVDVDELMTQARQRYAAGIPQEALELAVRALACKQDTAMYQAAAMFACAARDQARARRYFAEVPAERQSGIVQKCVEQGLQLP